MSNDEDEDLDNFLKRHREEFCGRGTEPCIAQTLGEFAWEMTNDWCFEEDKEVAEQKVYEELQKWGPKIKEVDYKKKYQVLAAILMTSLRTKEQIETNIENYSEKQSKLYSKVFYEFQRWWNYKDMLDNKVDNIETSVEIIASKLDKMERDMAWVMKMQMDTNRMMATYIRMNSNKENQDLKEKGEGKKPEDDYPPVPLGKRNRID